MSLPTPFHAVLRLSVFLFCAVMVNVSYAEIRNGGNNIIRVRVGPGGPVATVIYNAGIPSDMSGLPGVAGMVEGTTVSTNTVGGGSGIYPVRFVTDTNARPPAAAPLTGEFTYVISGGLDCDAGATPNCNGVTISFDKISWIRRDNDTLNTVDTYPAAGSVVFQTQTDFNPASNGTNTRHRNWYQYRYMNDTLLPAGTYEGVVRITGEATN